jgi:UDP-N-acetylmuramoylalanine--D-glutamate ligase
MRNYFNQKSKILKNLTNDDTAILNCNHDLIESKALNLLKNKKNNIISLHFEKRKSQSYSSKKKLIITSKLKKIKHSNPHLNGEHNEENVQITYQVLSSLQLKNLFTQKALNSYIGLNHRQELIFDNNKTMIINDSKATNIESMVRAIKNYKNIYLICGGVLKDKNLNMLLPYVSKLKKVYITGVDKKLFINFFSKTNKIFSSSNLNEVIRKCYSDIDLKKHSTILFCPGAASFDQYKNFEERGKKFKKLITRKFV